MEDVHLSDILIAERNEKTRESGFVSLFKIANEDYPGFFTIKEFIVMLDGCLKRPFFIRNQNS